MKAFLGLGMWLPSCLQVQRSVGCLDEYFGDGGSFLSTGELVEDGGVIN